MNTIEIDALQQSLSNEARCLYCLYLRVNMDTLSQRVIIKNKQISDLLNGKTTVISRGRQITALLQELAGLGLVEFDTAIDTGISLNNQSVKLPLVSFEDTKNLHQAHKAMYIQWRPDDEDFETIAQLVGLIDKEYNAEEMGEFIAYWLGRPEIKLSAFQWTQKFVIQLKHRRLTKPRQQNASKAGHQWISPQAGLAFDDNVKKLIQQYSKK